MTKEEARELLVQTCGSINLNIVQHQRLQEAIKILYGKNENELKASPEKDSE